MKTILCVSCVLAVELSIAAQSNTTAITIPAGTALQNSGITIHQSPSVVGFPRFSPGNAGVYPEKNPVTFDGTGKPQTVIFQFQAVWGSDYYFKPATATIFNFPYEPAYFKWAPVQVGFWETGIGKIEQATVSGLVLKKDLQLRVKIRFPAKTNFDAVGRMTITPAKPIFDFVDFEKPSLKHDSLLVATNVPPQAAGK